jgi:hypothetical protein
MIPHRYPAPIMRAAFFQAIDPIQREADAVGRQEVTVDWYLEYMIDAPIWRCMPLDAADWAGGDPWRYFMDLPIEPEDIKARGWRMFVQKNQIPAGAVAKTALLMAREELDSELGQRRTSGNAEEDGELPRIIALIDMALASTTVEVAW